MSPKKRRTKKKKHRERPRAVRAAPQQLVEGFEEARSLIRRRRWAEAREILESLNDRYPKQEPVLAALIDLSYDMGDVRSYQLACARLLRLRPNDPDLTLMLAGSYLANAWPFLSLRTFREFLERWPDHSRAADARGTVADIEARVPALTAHLGLTGDDAPQLAAWHEDVLALLDQAEFGQAQQVAGRLLERRPDFLPALNNLAEAHFRQGQADEAMATARRVLERDRENVHALSNLTRYLFLSGRPDEARAQAERLKAVQSPAPDGSVKKVEALSYLGDDRGVLDALSEAEHAGKREGPSDGYLYHLAAVAALRQGDENEARRCWKTAIEWMPGLEAARANLADLDRPTGERHAPWPFRFAQWLPPDAIQDLLQRIRPGVKGGALARQAREYLQARPEVAALVPVLLDRGDPAGREFALRLARTAETPELLAAVRDFALGRRGPDATRLEAAQVASQAGLLPSGPVHLWMDGEWREVLLMGWQLHGEPRDKHSARVAQRAGQAMEALHAADPERAERLLKKALEDEPDASDLLNNLAMAYQMQGRLEEALDLTRRIYERDPDYLFARVTLARLAMRDREPDKAKALLDPMLARKRLHFSEFAALCAAEIDLFLTEGNRDAARSWFEMWEQTDPDNPALGEFRRRFRGGGVGQRLKSWIL
jgi:tetratricopeptide (TPR) repeat protein